MLNLGGRILANAGRAWRYCTVACAIAVTLLAVAGGGGVSVQDMLSTVPDNHAGAQNTYEWKNASSMIYPRASSAVVVLSNGNIMVTGGMTSSGPSASTEIFDVSQGTWKLGPSMMTGRVGHTATLLKDGSVLIVGGDTSNGATSSAEILDARAAASYLLPGMSFARSGHAAILLPSGNVLVTGGTDWVSGTWYQAEMYNSTQHKWYPAGSMSKARVSFSLHVLSDGSVLAAGGDSGATSEKYNPAANTWSGSAQMTSKRYSSASVKLDNGKILVAGGLIDRNPTRITELYDPASNSWSRGPNMTTERASFSLAVLKDGLAFAAGSYSMKGTTTSTEAYSPSNNTWWKVQPMSRSRGSQGSAVVESGKALYQIGGWSNGALTSSVERFSEAPPKPSKPCMPIDLVPFVEAATELPGQSRNGLLAKLYAAQEKYELNETDVCLNVLNAFYNQVKAFALNGHMSLEHYIAIHEAYSSVVTCLGGSPPSLISMVFILVRTIAF